MRPACSDRRRRLAAVAAWGLLVACAGIPAAAERLPVQRFTQFDGLADDWVRALHQDRTGFLWIATQSGLSRFDGRHFVTYDARHGLRLRNMRQILETSDGHLWVATGEGVARLGPLAAEGARFEFWSLGPFPEHSARALYEDSQRRLWVAAGDRLLHVVEGGGEVRFEPLPLRAPARAAVSSVSSVVEGAERDLWVSTAAGLVRILPDDRQVLYPIGDAGQPLPDGHMAFDATGTLWIQATGGIYALHPELSVDAPAVDWEERIAVAQEAPDPACRARAPGDVCLYTDPDLVPLAGSNDLVADGSDVWIAGDTGLVRFDGESFRRVDMGRALLGTRISTLLQDADGSLWLGTESEGLLRLVPRGPVSFDDSDGLAGPLGNQLLETPGGELAVVSWWEDGHWLNVLSGGRFSALRPRGLAGPWGGRGWHQWVVIDHRGEWWIPSAGDGLYRYPAVARVEQLATRAPIARYTAEDGLPGVEFFRAFATSDGDLWLGLLGEQATAVWDRRSNRFLALGPAEGLPGAPGTAATPSAFAEDGEGRLWIGFYGGGVARSHDARRRSFELFGPAEGLPEAWVLDLFADSRGRLWIGTGDEILRVDDPGAARPRFERVSTEPAGFLLLGISSFAEDRFGRIYVGSTVGVGVLDPESGQWRRLTTRDGVASDAVRTILTTRDGDIWLGTRNGLTRLSPQAPEAASPLPVRIREVLVAGRPLPVPDLGTVELAGLELPPRENRLTVGYVGISLRPGEVLRYQYRLHGLDDSWSPPSPEPSVTFAAVPPGRFRFEVRAVRDDGTVSAVPARLTFRRLPPLWQRWWFLVVVLGALAALAAWLHRLRVTRVLELERLRGQIAGDLHDDVGAGLSEIAILSEVARGQESGEADAILGKIAARARRLREALGDTVWAVDPRQDQAAALLQRMRDVAYNLLESGGVQVDFIAPDGDRLERVPLAPDRRRDLLLLFKELVHNTARHAGAARVDVRLEKHDDELLLEVRDDGCGFNPMRASDGHGLTSVQTRAQRLGAQVELDTAPGCGCVVRLVVPLRA